ncbi:TrmH family RNA methyltransferase [Nesterenkonia sp. PF2B19]|uniref:TrmH family RNA methyltransferase n=1 Tax=Nesterenkonia sp. PF2B19 TaxID=1881858 RepID=UPI0009F61712|nr:RNA methyltransferase [Nesterenkonia sp. PF2B19]OSM44725.1 rRNA methyltransferase [Nesterenkonia sp. PF2B19]
MSGGVSGLERDAVASVPNPIVVLDSADDPRATDYRSLTDAALRRRQDIAHGMYMAESSQVVRRAVDAGHRPRSFFMEHRHLAGLADVVARWPQAPVYLGEQQVLQDITGFHLHRGALAAMHRPAELRLDEVLDGIDADQKDARLRVGILEDLTDHTNVGAVFRSAAALGVDAVLLSPACADPLYRRAIRVSMGAVFQMPWTRVHPWPDGLASLQAAGFVVAGLSLGEGSVPLDDLVAQDHSRLALVLGNEGDGLREETERRLDARVTIPMMRGVDSLNVAAASAVAFYSTR